MHVNINEILVKRLFKYLPLNNVHMFCLLCHHKLEVIRLKCSVAIDDSTIN